MLYAIRSTKHTMAQAVYQTRAEAETHVRDFGGVIVCVLTPDEVEAREKAAWDAAWNGCAGTEIDADALGCDDLYAAWRKSQP